MIFKTFSLFFAVFLCGKLNAADEEFDARLRSLAQVNRFSPLETAASHGAIGFSLGAAVSSTLVSDSEYILQQTGERDFSEGTSDKRVYIPKLVIMKGLRWPIDIGISFAKPVDSEIEQLTGHVQWSVYEALARPALAVRAAYSRLFGINGSFASIGADAVMSFGFLRYFTLYGGTGFSRNEGFIRESISKDYYGLTHTEPEAQKAWVEGSRFAGLNVLIFPPLIHTCIEAESRGAEEYSYSAKMSIAM